MQIDKSVNQAWAFTYKFLGDLSGRNDSIRYAPVIDNLNANGFVKYVQGEFDPKGKYHIHGIVLLRKGMLRKKLIVQGFNCHLSEIVNEDVWLRYCNKDQPSQKEIPYLFDPIYEINT